MYLLANLMLWGDVATNLLSEARAEAGLNPTQAQICLVLSGAQDGIRGSSQALTPSEVSRALCSPGSRVHNQLRLLMEMKLVRRTESGSAADGRSRRYELTPAGLKQVSLYVVRLKAANKVFSTLVSAKEQEALDRLEERLSHVIEIGALDSKSTLESAVVDGAVDAPRRRHLWS